jgi:MarR family transcriptional regulator, transcriptional regulator for hemolysin
VAGKGPAAEKAPATGKDRPTSASAARSATLARPAAKASAASGSKASAASRTSAGTKASAAREAPRPLAANLCWLLSQASYTLTTELTAALEGLGISPRAHAVLIAAMTGDHTQIELARMVGLDKTTMVVTLDELEAAGLAERRPSRHDRRARVIAVTKAGERKVREAEEIVQRIHADVLSALPARQRKVFLEGLTRLVSERLSEPAVSATPVRRRAPRAAPTP